MSESKQASGMSQGTAKGDGNGAVETMVLAGPAWLCTLPLVVIGADATGRCP